MEGLDHIRLGVRSYGVGPVALSSNLSTSQSPFRASPDLFGVLERTR